VSITGHASPEARKNGVTEYWSTGALVVTGTSSVAKSELPFRPADLFCIQTQAASEPRRPIISSLRTHYCITPKL
jgi:hypothetical protein